MSETGAGIAGIAIGGVLHVVAYEPAVTIEPATQPATGPAEQAQAEDLAPQPADRRLSAVPAGHPVAVGAGVAGLVTLSVLRRRTREPRDEPRVLIGF